MTQILECFKDCPVEPVGYRMILGQLPPKKKTDGGIVIPDGTDTSRAQEILSSISQVVKLGPLCFEGDHFYDFSEKRRFWEVQHGNRDGKSERVRHIHATRKPWVEVGDWILHGPNSGFRVPVESNGTRVVYRILNDDEFLAVIPNIDELIKVMPVLTYNLTT